MSGWRVAVNALAFQAAWLAAVCGAAAGQPWIGPAAAALAVALHAAAAAAPSRELAGIAMVAVLGTLWDTLPAATGLIEYRSGVPELGGTPYWIAALWCAFATTLNVSLRWLRARPLLALALGAIAGPACYRAAAAFGALELAAPRTALAAQALAWAALLPAALAIAARYDGAGTRPAHANA